MKRIKGNISRIEIDDAGSFHIYLDCGPTYRRTLWYWIDPNGGHYQIRQCIEGRYKRSYKGRTYTSELIGPTFPTYDAARPALAALFVRLLGELGIYSNGILACLDVKQVEKR